MNDVCSWCGKKTSKIKEIEIDFLKQKRKVKKCSDSCESQLRDYYKYAETHLKYFTIGIVIPIFIGIIVPVLFEGIYGTNVAVMFSILIILVGVGATIVKYPFATGSTIVIFGAKRGIFIGRLIGIFMIILGILMSILIWSLELF